MARYEVSYSRITTFTVTVNAPDARRAEIIAQKVFGRGDDVCEDCEETELQVCEVDDD